MTINCPYCDYENEELYGEDMGDEDKNHNIACEGCDKHFSCFYSISYDWGSQPIEEDLEWHTGEQKRLQERMKETEGRKKNNGEQNQFAIQCCKNDLSSNRRKIKELRELTEGNLTLTNEK